MCTFYMPLDKVDKFYVNKQTAKEYAQQFVKDVGFLEWMGVNVKLGKVAGVDWDKVWKGVKKMIGIAGAKGKDEL